MNTGVEILLKRMQDRPEDFVYSPHNGGMSRWMRLVDHAIGEELLTQEEHDAIKAGLLEVKRVRFTELVMKELAGAEYESGEGTIYYSNPQKDMWADSHIEHHKKLLSELNNKEKTELVKMLDYYVEHNKKKANAK